MALSESGEEEALAAKLALAADVDEASAPKENGASHPQPNGSGDQQDFDDVRLCHATLEYEQHTRWVL